jgi:hypothetical protein
MLDGPADTPRVVRDDAGRLGDLPVQQHQRLLLGDHPDRGVAHARAPQHHALHQVQRALHDVAFDLARLRGVREQQRISGMPGGLLGPLDDLAVERVRDVGDHQRDGTGLPTDRSGDLGGAIADPLGGREDRPGRLDVDPSRTGVGTGDGGGSDTGFAGHVIDRRTITHPVTIARRHSPASRQQPATDFPAGLAARPAHTPTSVLPHQLQLVCQRQGWCATPRTAGPHTDSGAHTATAVRVRGPISVCDRSRARAS